MALLGVLQRLRERRSASKSPRVLDGDTSQEGNEGGNEIPVLVEHPPRYVAELIQSRDPRELREPPPDEDLKTVTVFREQPDMIG